MGADQQRCSFCGKWRKKVRVLIAGPGVYICDECVDLCVEIIDKELGASAGEREREPAVLKPKPRVPWPPRRRGRN